MLQLQQGAVAPEFTLQDHTGTMRSLSEFKGSYVVLYFYPKDDTPGCTVEACTFRDNYSELQKLVEIVGVSGDSENSHGKFIKKFQLPFPLLADVERKMIQAYGADGVVFPKRVSFLINPEGKIVKVYGKVVPADHAKQILEDVKAMV